MPAKLHKILLILGIAAVLAAIPLFWLYYEPSKNLEVDFLDVGQGDAILIKTPNGQNILIDGGPDKTVMRRLGENLAWWDRKIDLMVLTHPHDDHVTGLIDVLKKYQVKQILYTGVNHTAPNYLTWLKILRDKKIKLIIAAKPQAIKLGDNCEINILYPLNSFLGGDINNLNDSSLVIKLIFGQTKFLLAGDLEIKGETELINAGADLSATVLKVGHHGSDTSSSQEFIDKIKPQFAVVEVGANNDFGHPSGRVLKRLERSGAKIFRTDIDKTVKLVSNGAGVEIK